MTATPVRRRVEQVMGLPVSVALRGRHTDGPGADAAWAAVMADLREADRVFSTYREDSFVSRLDRGEVVAADGPREVLEVLAIGERARLASGGAFDVVRGGRLDPSGVVKGWAVERAARHLRALEDTDFCLSAGGDMVVHVASARAGDQRPDWRIGVEDASDPLRVLAVVALRDGAVATSGLAHRGAHVVDARTGRAPRRLSSVTVVAASLTDADVDATTALALDADAPRWLAARPGRTAYLQWTDGTTTRLPD
ncbi:MAG: FAD:protein FMN transferase [Nocardioides sp.]